MRSLRSFLKVFGRNRRGAVAVEFALTAPFLMMLIYGMFEAGRYFWWQNQLDYAVQTASRYGGVTADATTAQIAAVVDQHLTIDTTNVTVTVTESVDATTGLTFREVEASIPYSAYMLATEEFLNLTVVARSKYLMVE